MSGAVRVLVILLIAGLMALFCALALDMAIPVPTDPLASSMHEPVPPAKQAEFEKTRSDIQASLDAGEITAGEADEQLSVVDDEESSYYVETSDAYIRDIANRGLAVSLATMVIVALLLTAGVAMVQRGVELGAVALFAGAFLGIYAVGMGAQAEIAWIRVVLSGAVAVGVAGAGMQTFGRPVRS